jgi:hypothetical protein
MGYMRHHAIVVTTFSSDPCRICGARNVATELGLACTSIVKSPTNGYLSFMVAPDGSKEGWPESEVGDSGRQSFIAWLDAQRYSDGSSPYDWVLLQYGDDEKRTAIIRHSDDVELTS